MFYVIQAGGSLQVVTTAGAIDQTLTLPDDITVSSTVRGHFAILNQQLFFVTAGTVNLWISPTDFTVRPMSIRPPTSAPLLAAGSGTGITGAVRVKVSFTVKDENGVLLQESPLGPASAAVTLADDDLSMTLIPKSTSDVVTGRRLYRTLAGGSVYFQFLDIDDNHITEATSGVPDAGVELLPADPELGNPPGAVPGTTFDLLVAWRNRLWGKPGAATLVDQIWFCDQDKFYAWASTNFLLASPAGEDGIGITAFMPRRDELVVAKQTRLLKVVGKDEDDFEVIGVVENVGCLAPDSPAVIRDIAYFLGLDGVYSYGPSGVQKISDKVEPWFTRDDTFNRSLFPQAVGTYNPTLDTYDLQLAAAGSAVLDRWVSYDIRRKEWLGPHKTAAFTPSTRALLRNADGQARPIMGSSTGFLYLLNQTGASDGGTAIPIDWITKHFNGQAPDREHFWGQATVHLKRQGAAAGAVTLTPRVGSPDSTVDGTPQAITQRVDRVITDRFGDGNSGETLRLEFTHNIDAEDVDLRGLELPFVEVGRRMKQRTGG